MSRLSLENRNSDLSRDISFWEDISNIWNDPEYTPTTELFNNNLQQTEIPHSKVATLAKATPEKCQSRFNAVVLNLKRIITMWERSGQGEGGFLHEEEEAQLGMNEFGSLAGRSENALSNRANFVGGNGKHFLYLWDLIDKYNLMKTCTQIIGSEFAAASGDNVRIIYDSKRAQLKDDEDDDASSMSSKQIKSEMSTFGGSIMKLATNNVMIAKMKAMEREKDRQEKEKDSLAAEEIHRNEVIEREKDLIEREKDRILQQKQSLEMEISRLRQDKRGYLIQMSERDEKRRKTR
jgi:membrane-associated HD superfamily phosphohydrolase